MINYLQFLLDDRGLSYHTVKSRVNAIASEHTYYKHRKGRFDALLRHALLKDFLKGALIKKPPVRDPTPTWDLPIVLMTLSNPPFEPIDQISLKYLTWKTAFLLAICSANRVHELKAMDVRPTYCEFTPRGVTLRTNPTFRPKVVKEGNMQRVLHFAPLIGDDTDPGLEL